MQPTRIAALIVTYVAATIPATSILAQVTSGVTTRTPITRMTPPVTVATPQTSSGLTPVSNRSPLDGPYKLVMTATTIAGQPAGSGHVGSINVSVIWSDTTIAITEVGGTTFKGRVANNQLTASSQTSDGTLSLTGTTSAHHASGTFNATRPDGKTVSGTFVLTASGPTAMLAKVQEWGTPKPVPKPPSSAGVMCTLFGVWC